MYLLLRVIYSIYHCPNRSDPLKVGAQQLLGNLLFLRRPQDDVVPSWLVRGPLRLSMITDDVFDCIVCDSHVRTCEQLCADTSAPSHLPQNEHKHDRPQRFPSGAVTDSCNDLRSRQRRRDLESLYKETHCLRCCVVLLAAHLTA